MFATERGLVPAARCALAVSMGKAVRGGVRRLGRGNGSSLPGAVALAVDPGTLAGLCAQSPPWSGAWFCSQRTGRTRLMPAHGTMAARLMPILHHPGLDHAPGPAR